MKRSKGPGTASLLLGLIANLSWLSFINDVSVIQIIGEKMGFTDAAALTPAALIVTVPGVILGIARHRDWGAKVGAAYCFGVAICVSAPLVKTMI
jgi:hypothetical protein